MKQNNYRQQDYTTVNLFAFALKAFATSKELVWMDRYVGANMHIHSIAIKATKLRFCMGA